jgi:hypothetical protein
VNPQETAHAERSAATRREVEASGDGRRLGAEYSEYAAPPPPTLHGTHSTPPLRGSAQGERVSGGWQLCLASVRGSEHARLLRNNQDAVAACARGDRTAVAVADGCSEGPFSEVGARLVVRFLTHRACESARWGAELATEVTDALVAWLYTLARGCGELEAFVQEQLLTTFLCAAVRGGEALVFGVGDGVVHVDGRTQVLDAGPENAPPYVAYRLLPLGGAPLAVHHSGPARNIALATDGLNAKLDLLDGAFDWKNPLALQRRLNVTRGLFDDTTLALLRAA